MDIFCRSFSMKYSHCFYLLFMFKTTLKIDIPTDSGQLFWDIFIELNITFIVNNSQ